MSFDHAMHLQQRAKRIRWNSSKHSPQREPVSMSVIRISSNDLACLTIPVSSNAAFRAVKRIRPRPALEKSVE